MVTRGFGGRRPTVEVADRLPPGQYLTEDFPVLSAGPTPRVKTQDWSFELKIGPKPVKKWRWEEFNALPLTRMTRDIHCVTAWSKFNTAWEGVLVDDVLADAGIEPEYVEARDLERLEPIETFNGRPVLFALAARVGGARLIDNVIIEPDAPAPPAGPAGPRERNEG